jgi:hypothetical protein
MKLNPAQFLVAILLTLPGPAFGAAIIFDNFNVDEGHFGFAPNFSGTTVGEDPTSTADMVTEGSLEGAGNQRLHLVHDATATALRVRHLSGGPPYNSGNAGNPAGNVAFTTSPDQDGFIGFYLKTTVAGFETSINLDGSGNTISEMDGSISLPIIADGEWHLYEWDLDSTTDWTFVPAIGGGHGGALLDGSHTIDSIYFRDVDGIPDPTADFSLDFVAKSDSGSIAALVPEPSAAAFMIVAAAGMLGSRRRRGIRIIA